MFNCAALSFFVISVFNPFKVKIVIDLAEVMSVQPVAPAPGPPKKTDDKSFFDVSVIVAFRNDLFVI